MKSKIFQSGFTQEQIAHVLQIEHTAFSRMIRGQRTMPENLEQRIDDTIILLTKADQAAQEARDKVLGQSTQKTNTQKVKTR